MKRNKRWTDNCRIELPHGILESRIPCGSSILHADYHRHTMIIRAIQQDSSMLDNLPTIIITVRLGSAGGCTEPQEIESPSGDTNGEPATTLP